MHEQQCPPRRVRQRRLTESARRRRTPEATIAAAAVVPRSGVTEAVPRFRGSMAALLDLEGKRRRGPNAGERWRPQGHEAGERRRHLRGRRASGDNAPKAGKRRCRTPMPERRRHTITLRRASSDDAAQGTSCTRRRSCMTSSGLALFGHPK